ncbi:MAG: hypothetical protein ACP5I1_13385 [Candidatus Hinthialibacter sp.]
MARPLRSRRTGRIFRPGRFQAARGVDSIWINISPPGDYPAGE